MKTQKITDDSHWTELWRTHRIYQPDLRNAKKPFYNLMMFPYPSAEGLHVGNMYAFTGADVHGRFKRMQGYDVFEPIGLDGFGIHSENYAIKIGKHPVEQAKVSEHNFYKQLSQIGNSYAWEHRLETYNTNYYKWTQWLFIQMFKRGLAYRKSALVNWCPSCKTVLADEQVESGLCERCKSKVMRKEMKQWFFKITAYADRLLENITKINWPEKIKIAQRQWIGRKDGALVDWEVIEVGKIITTFTTRLDTLFGVTFLVLAPDHPIINQLKIGKDAMDYCNKALIKSEQQRKLDQHKIGVDTGYKVRHPITKEAIPVWIGEFVLMDVGTGVVMGVPAHDQRDFEFAITNKIPIKQVVLCDLKNIKKKPWMMFDVEKRLTDQQKCDLINNEVRALKFCYEGEGILIQSNNYSEMTSIEAREKILKDHPNIIKPSVHYHLRDWLISRQRYWGPPIPMMYCPACAKASAGKENAGWIPVEENDLPVELPYVADYQPIGQGKSPLEKAGDEWLYTQCPQCGGRAKRETDVSDTFLDSSWYFLAYPNLETEEWKSHMATWSNGQMVKEKRNKSNHLTMQPFNHEVTTKWLPVNAYIGGAEHAVLHLLYSRFVWMCLRDWGYLEGIDSDEPFPFLFSHGLIVKDGAKMSKSRGNVVVPDAYIAKYGADALRCYLMFLGPYDQGGDFRDTGIEGMYRFLKKIWRFFQEENSQFANENFDASSVSLANQQSSSSKTQRRAQSEAAQNFVGSLRLNKIDVNTSPTMLPILHKTIKEVTEDVEKFHYNTALSSLMELFNAWKQDGAALSVEDAVSVLKLLAPFAPFLSEELYQRFANENFDASSVSLANQQSSSSKTQRRAQSEAAQNFVGSPTTFVSIHTQPWPTYDSTLLITDTVSIVVQVNGRLRGNVTVSHQQSTNQSAIEEIAQHDERIGQWLKSGVKKVVFVPCRLINFVV